MKKGFTLIELLVVISIIAVLAVVVLINVEAANAQARDAQRKKDLTLIAGALENYKAVNKTYVLPTTLGGTAIPGGGRADSQLSPLVSSNYIQSIPNDPVQGGYWYGGDPAQFKLISTFETSSQNNANPCTSAGDFCDPSNVTYDPKSALYLQLSGGSCQSGICAASTWYPLNNSWRS
jgi:general secretion pathway protein G